ncbi:MAG TPA: ABC transporter permease [Humisphaera sp.]
MTTIATPVITAGAPDAGETLAPSDRPWRRALRSGRVLVGGGILLAVTLVCLLTLPLTLREGGRLYYNDQDTAAARQPPNLDPPTWFGTDMLGRSLLGRCLLGGCISLLVGLAAAGLSVTLGVTVGLLAGYRGGWVDAALMRFVDILYGLPYVLLIVLFKIALEPVLSGRLGLSPAASNLVVLFLAIGLVSWLTMARVVRGQVLSLRAQPFIEACRAMGLPEWRIFTRHLLPNLVGPVIVYATLTVPQAILQESFLSFLGIGIQAPMPTWGSLANDGLVQALNTVAPRVWMLLFPCLLLAVTLLSLNFLGDGLRDVFDPKREAAKI